MNDKKYLVIGVCMLILLLSVMCYGIYDKKNFIKKTKYCQKLTNRTDAIANHYGSGRVEEGYIKCCYNHYVDHIFEKVKCMGYKK